MCAERREVVVGHGVEGEVDAFGGASVGDVDEIASGRVSFAFETKFLFEAFVEGMSFHPSRAGVGSGHFGQEEGEVWRSVVVVGVFAAGDVEHDAAGGAGGVGAARFTLVPRSGDVLVAVGNDDGLLVDNAWCGLWGLDGGCGDAKGVGAGSDVFEAGHVALGEDESVVGGGR